MRENSLYQLFQPEVWRCSFILQGDHEQLIWNDSPSKTDEQEVVNQQHQWKKASWMSH